MTVIVVESSAQYNKLFEESKGKKVLVYLTATWCGPCRAIGPVFEKLSDSNEGKNIVFVKVDIDKCPELDIVKNVLGVPTFIAYNHGEVFKQFTGAQPSNLTTLVSELNSK
eukprot:gene2566-3179_t